MSIDASVVWNERLEDGTVMMHLEPSSKDAIAGQPALVVLNPSVYVPPEGTKLWGGCASIMEGDQKIGVRVGYTRVRMLESVS